MAACFSCQFFDQTGAHYKNRYWIFWYSTGSFWPLAWNRGDWSIFRQYNNEEYERYEPRPKIVIDKQDVSVFMAANYSKFLHRNLLSWYLQNCMACIAGTAGTGFQVETWSKNPRKSRKWGYCTKWIRFSCRAPRISPKYRVSAKFYWVFFLGCSGGILPEFLLAGNFLREGEKFSLGFKP